VYGEGKRAMEMLSACYADAHDIEIMTARCFAFIGYGLPKHLAIGQLINDALYADEITVKGDGKPVRSYLYAADLAVWLLVILLRGKSSSAYNVGSDVAMSIASVAFRIKDALSLEKPVCIGNKNENIQAARISYVPDISHSLNELDVMVWTPLDEAIKKHSLNSKFHIL